MEEFCRVYVLRNTTEIISHLKASKVVLELGNNKKVKNLTKHYHEARKFYKEIEFFVEYYSSFDAKFYLNGPLVPKIELEISSKPFPPHGFQVLEENLFDLNKTNFEVLKSECDLLLTKFEFLKEYYSTINIEQNKMHDALKLEVIRIMCLTLNGYDCTINKESILECKFALTGVETILNEYYKNNLLNENQKSLLNKSLQLIKSSKKELFKNPDSDIFNRLNFMTEFLNPLYVSLQKFFNELNLADVSLFYAVNFKENSFFEPNSINKQYFSVYVSDSGNLNKQAELGQLLFFDPILSGNNKRACSSCHNSNQAFTDGLEKSVAFNGIDRLTRNAPTLINAAYQKLFFHDGRQFNLEEQANSVFNNPLEMNSNENEIAYKLKQSSEYRSLFKDAFYKTPDTAVTSYAVLKCLSEFIKTLDSRHSKFDKYLRGNKSFLNEDEKNGYNLFAGKALCGSCHFFPLFNGTVPPMFNDNEFEVLGTPEKLDNRNIDSDLGRKNITNSSIHNHAFKTPTLRNIAYTAPYMHNGVYDNLDSVLVFYNKGGGVGLGLKVDNQTLPFDSLGLSKKELNNIKLFLLTLSDTIGLPKAPTKLPRFENQSLNKRKIGGEY